MNNNRIVVFYVGTPLRLLLTLGPGVSQQAVQSAGKI
jgi:hypothetical protein